MPGPDLGVGGVAVGGVEPMQIDITDDQNENSAVDQPQQPEMFIVENPALDVESYIANYTGTARLLRLIHIADHCPPLKIEALKLAIAHVYKTMNVGMYQQLHKKLHDAVTALTPALPDVAVGGAAAPAVVVVPPVIADLPKVDTNWIEQTTKKAAVMLDKLDTDLKNYKSNSIKESIRRGYDDLGEFYLECGDLMSALKSFSRARDYCTSAKHVISMCLNVIKVSIYLQNWSHVFNFVAKAENTPDPTDEKKATKEHSNTNSKLQCAMGLAELAMKKYKSAAKHFLQVNFDQCDFSDIISPNNVAVYAGLCALATFDRSELQESVIGSSSFKLFLELEPQMRDVLTSFHESKYDKCLLLLDEMKDSFLLDISISPHVRTLYSEIRSRGLVQYFRPYASADMIRMAQSFNTNVTQLENELMALILDGQIQARIDSHNKILHAKNVDERYFTFEKTLRMGLEYERRTKLMILRTAILRANIQVKAASREGQGDPASNNLFRSHRDRSDS